MPEPWQPILDIADKLEPAVRREFLKAFNQVRASINIDRLAEAIRAGDVARVMNQLKLDPASASFDKIRALFAQGFERAGIATASSPGGMVLRFNMKNQLIPNLIDQFIGRDIVLIDTATRRAVQDIIQEAFSEGMHPYESARHIQQVVGLHPRWEQAVRNYRDTLKAQGKTDWRIEQLTQRYSNRLRKKRAVMIARTETLTAANMGRLEAWLQSQEAGWIPLTAKKRWIVTPDDRLCERCAPMRIEEPVLLRDPFESTKLGFPPGDLRPNPKGATVVMQPPLHPNCFVGDTLVSTSGEITAVTERVFDGDMVVVTSRDGKQFTVTPNHPILTWQGWVPAGRLQPGDDLVCSPGMDGVRGGNLDYGDMPTRIEEIAETFRHAGSVASRPVPVSAVDFHGDGKQSEVAVVSSDLLLRDHVLSPALQNVEQVPFIVGDVFRPVLAASSRGLNESGVGFGFPPSSFMGWRDLAPPFGGIHARPLDTFGVASSAHRNPSFEESTTDDPAADLEAVCESLLGLSAQIATDQVVDIQVVPFHGPVYNLETSTGYYMVDGGVVAHNCRCTMVLSVD